MGAKRKIANDEGTLFEIYTLKAVGRCAQTPGNPSVS
jgi:hypothetical protein